MDLLQAILNAQGGTAVQQLGNHVGLGQRETVAAVEQLLPSLAAGLKHNTTQPGGLEGLMAALSGGSHQQYLDDPTRLASPETVQDGNGILGHILGSKDEAGASGSPAAQAGLVGMLTPLLDSNKDGSVVDDVMGMMGKFLR